MDEQRETREELVKAIERRERQRLESIERSDTDGFLSQWAMGRCNELDRLKLQIIDAGGKAEFRGLYEGDRRVKAKLLDGQYGYYWLLHESETHLIEMRGKPFIPQGKKSRVQKKLGLHESMEMAPAWAYMEGQGTGMSGTCWAARFRTGDPWGSDSEKIEG